MKIIDNPKTVALLAAMRPGEFRRIASNQTLVATRDGLAAYVLTNNDYAYPYLHTCAIERARVEEIIAKGEGANT